MRICSCSQFQQFLPASFTVMVPSWAILILGAEHLQAITCSTRMESQKLDGEGERAANHQPPFAKSSFYIMFPPALVHYEMPLLPPALQRPAGLSLCWEDM